MRYRNLGSTGLRVSEIAFGTIPILSGNVPVLPHYYSPDEDTAISIMEHAFKLGCNLFDTAIVPEYGDAEIKLGRFAVLSYPISSALIGMGTHEQVDQAMLKEPENYNRPTFSQVMSMLEKSFMPIPCDRCQRCRCIYGTEIHIIFRQYNYYFLGKDYWALRKLDLNINESAEQCKKCTDMSCMKKCPHGINIPETMQMIKRLVEIHVRNSFI